MIWSLNWPIIFFRYETFSFHFFLEHFFCSSSIKILGAKAKTDQTFAASPAYKIIVSLVSLILISEIFDDAVDLKMPFFMDFSPFLKVGIVYLTLLA